ncbi:hypothetical protein EZS27_008007 [termite gut metagenome]|uniref:CRISPR-associated protein Cas5 n=1 Tax=termite gut metagenome TaxID=433724 RepID=A0A5J4SDW2_9ZZZZ
MKLYRIKISSWTSSFRYPNIISGFQPTLEVPPVSTVLGLINACSGKYLKHNGLEIGYYFDYKIKATDLETIYQIEQHDQGYPKNQVKSNIISREFLYDCRLFIYLKDDSFIEYFDKPHYQLLLGRSNDLATIEEKGKEIDVEEVENAEYIKGQVVPFKGNSIPGLLQALPKYFTDTIPRKTLGTEAYTVISCNDSTGKTTVNAYRDSNVDDGKVIDIYFHKINLCDD